VNLPFKYLSKFPSETEQISKEFASIVFLGDFILLKGRLGAGKTKFVSGFVKNICNNSDNNIVTSPTFSLMNRYFCDENIVIDHFDFYRLKNLYDLENSGFFDSLASDSITIAEWGDKIDFDYRNILKNYYFEVTIIAKEDGSKDIDNKNTENKAMNINNNHNDNAVNLSENSLKNLYREIIINKKYI
jgi:tRNA threonylcarbamoyladenosine biosynthesis protein TsaE